jgi:TonB-dependent receptor
VLPRCECDHQRNDPNNWNIVEVSAGYMMSNLEVGRLQIYTGLRFEATDLIVLGYHVTIDANGNYVSTSPARSTSSYLNPLPSAQIRCRISPMSGIRLAYGRGIARPDFGDLPPYVVLSDRAQSISVGNPNLKPTRANNYDLLYEQYLNPLGVIQAGFFYEDIRSPIYYVQSDVTSGSYAGFQQTAPLNGSSAYVYGFEIAYQQHLSFLPGLFRSAGISANYSWTTSQANGVPGRSDSPALLRQTPNTWNVSPTYDRGRLSLRVGLRAKWRPISVLAPASRCSGQLSTGEGFTAFVYGLNLNNEVFGFIREAEFTRFSVSITSRLWPHVSAGISPGKDKLPVPCTFC